jgi:membrane dipeptidase
MFILDSHCDTPSQILRLRDLSIDNDHAHVDFPKLKRGGVDGAFFALYIPASFDSDTDAAMNHASRLYTSLKASIEANNDRAVICTTAGQAYKNKEKGLFSVFIGLENGSPIGNSLERVKMFHDLGVRYITLCHSGNNQICDSCAPKQKKWGGLSPFGREVVAEMNRLGILVDVSHVSDETFYDVLECSSKPVVATHSCCRALAGHPRNMTDDMIRSLAAKGGVIQINFYPLFLDDAFGRVLDASGIMDRGEAVEAEFISDPSDMDRRKAWYAVQDELLSLERPSYKVIADHIDHVVSLTGTDHVGVGSDFDGIAVAPVGMEDASCFSRIFDELRLRGYSEEDIEKIAGGNFFRILAC